MKRLISPLLVSTLLVAACGGSDSDSEANGGNTESFCEMLRELDEESADLTEDFDASLAQLQALRAAAPEAIQGDLDVVLNGMDEMAAVEAASEGDDDADLEAIFAIFLDPEFVTASENLETFGVDECGLEPSTADG